MSNLKFYITYSRRIKLLTKAMEYNLDINKYAKWLEIKLVQPI